jgi:hypothetical protein
MKIVFVLSLLSLAHAAMYEGGTRQPTHVSCRSVLHKTDNSLTRKDVKLFNSCCNSLGGCTVNCYIPNTSVVSNNDITTLTCNMRNDTKLIAPFQKCYNRLSVNQFSLCHSEVFKSTYDCTNVGTLTHSTCNQK